MTCVFLVENVVSVNTCVTSWYNMSIIPRNITEDSIQLKMRHALTCTLYLRLVICMFMNLDPPPLVMRLKLLARANILRNFVFTVHGTLCKQFYFNAILVVHELRDMWPPFFKGNLKSCRKVIALTRLFHQLDIDNLVINGLRGDVSLIYLNRTGNAIKNV